MKRAAILLFLVACGGTDSGPHAAVQATFGVDPMRTLSSPPTSGTTDTRMMIQVVHGDAKVFVSLAVPIQAGVIKLDAARTDTQVWAQLGKEPPRIADHGELEVITSDGTVNLTLTNVSKPQDLMGGKLVLNGSISGVKL